DQRTTGRATARPADGWWVRRPYPAADSARRHRLELRPALVDEQASFERLAIFAGGCTLGAAQALFGDHARVGLESSHEAVAPDVLERLAGLIDKSLVQPAGSASGEPRFVMLETIGEFALERLEATGAAAILR